MSRHSDTDTDTNSKAEREKDHISLNKSSWLNKYDEWTCYVELAEGDLVMNIERLSTGS